MMLKQESLEQKALYIISQLPKPSNNIKECETALVQGNLNLAIIKIKQDIDLSKFISYINLTHKKLKNTPLLSKEGKLDEYGNRVMLDAIRLYCVYNAAPKQWKLLKLNPVNFRLFICYYLFDFYDIKTPDKNNQIFVFLPLVLGICEVVLREILIDPCAIAYMTNLNYNKLLKSTTGLDGFELLYQILKTWDINNHIIEQAQKLAECANANKNDMHDDFILAKTLLGFEFSREIFSTTNLRYMLDFDDELNLNEVKEIKEKLGEVYEDTL